MSASVRSAIYLVKRQRPKFTFGQITPAPPCDAARMKDMQAQLDRLLELAAECAEIASRATDKAKQDLFARLSEHFGVLASEVEKAIKKMALEE
jgi:hypothetical protein